MASKRPISELGVAESVNKRRCAYKPTELFKVVWVDKAPSLIWLKLLPLTSDESDSPSVQTKPLTCILKEFWSQTPVRAGDHVIIIADTEDTQDCVVVDNSNGFIILFPEIFLTGTTVSQSFYCMRKALIGELMRSDSSHIMLLGTIVHDWIQSCCIAGRDDFFGENTLRSFVEEPFRVCMLLLSLLVFNLFPDIVPKISPEEILSRLIHVPSYLLELYGLSLNDGAFNKQALEFLPATNRWVSANKTSVIDIEELIWSPTLGLKGRVDLTLKNNQPLEIKTGKPSYSVSHSGQVLMYTMLLSEKNNADIREGILYYARDGETKTFQAKHPELRGLIMARNEIAAHSAHPKRIADSENVPIISLARPLVSERQCRPCENRLHCVLFHYIEERCLPLDDDVLQLPPTHWMFDDLGRSTVAHLSSAHINFFVNLMLKTMRGLDNEIAVRVDKGANICMPQRVMEQSMRGLRLIRIEKHPSKSNLLYTFCDTRKGKPTSSKAFSLRPGDFVIIREDKPAALVIDYGHLESIESHPTDNVTEDGPSQIAASTSYDDDSSQTSVRTAHSDGLVSGTTVTVFVDRTLPNMRVWKKMCRIEKYDFGGPPKTLYENIFALFADNSYAAQLRRVLIDGEKPILRSCVSKELLGRFRLVVKNCAQDVKLAVLKSFMSSYSLVKLDERRLNVLADDSDDTQPIESQSTQPTETGTQQAVAAARTITRVAFSSVLIRSHLASNASVLLVCSSASLLDDILLDVLKAASNDNATAEASSSQASNSSMSGRVTRLGQVERIAPALLQHDQQHSIGFDIKLRTLNSTEAIDMYARQLVLVGALAGTKHAILRRRRFDICIIADAERVDLAIAAGSALVYADKFVLIGKATTVGSTGSAVSAVNTKTNNKQSGIAVVVETNNSKDGQTLVCAVVDGKEKAPTAAGESSRCVQSDKSITSDVVEEEARSAQQQLGSGKNSAPVASPLLESIFEHMKSSAGSAGVANTVVTYFHSSTKVSGEDGNEA